MNQTNIALLSALYNEKSNLYKEIYFPIIKFALALSLKESEDKRTSSIENLHFKIIKEFGVSIPQTIIKQAIKQLISSKILQINLTKDDFLRVNMADISFLDDIQDKGELVNFSLRRLEESYIHYFSALNIVPEKTLAEFFLAQTQEVINYLSNTEIEATLNEEYTHSVKYLSWLKTNDVELFESANKVLWGATVAGFLGRNHYEFNVKPVSECKYYLDTGIIMGCLDLSTEKSSRYSKELLQVLKSSGSSACVHPITLEEIRSIIEGVENEGRPRPYTPIYEAFERTELTCTQLASIRVHLQELIQNLGIQVIPEKENTVKIKNEYKGKNIVKKLEEQRSKARMGENYEDHLSLGGISNGFGLYGGNPRDIHDAYMIDFIRKINGQYSIREKVKAYFVTENRDLRKFSNAYHCSPINELIAPSSVIFEQWLHGASLESQIMDQVLLTEIMSRCLALNEQNATNKIRQISSQLKRTEMNDPKVLQEIYIGILERSNKYLLSEDKDCQSYSDPVKLSQLYEQAQLDIKEREQNTAEVQRLRDENLQISNEKEKAESELEKYKQREQTKEELKNEKTTLQDALDKLTPERQRAIRWFYFWIVLEVALNAILLSLFVFCFNETKPVLDLLKPEWENKLHEATSWLRFIVGIISIGLIYCFPPIGKVSRIFNFKRYKNQWDDERPEYMQNVNRLAEIEQELKDL